MVSVVQLWEIRRAESSEGIFQRNTSAYKGGRALCDGYRWGPNPQGQFEDGWDKLAESAENTGIQSGDPSCATVFTWFVVDTDGDGL
ncbi:MAG: hypothetical protein JETCAE01_02100 [Anaerolineaceae bacterium]|nr:MAG: hypothetical protein JETCAE01_02100 [Anaerolineaceae bacterium]